MDMGRVVEFVVGVAFFFVIFRLIRVIRERGGRRD